MFWRKRKGAPAGRRANVSAHLDGTPTWAPARAIMESLESRLLLSDTPITSINRTADSNPSQYVSVNGMFYFTSQDSSNHAFLWKSDGTETGTTQIASSGASNSPNTWFLNLTACGGKLYYLSPTVQGSGQALFVTDGTPAGTQQLLEGDMSFEGEPFFKELNGELYFVDLQGTTENLFRTDGTTGGTVQLSNWTANSSLQITTELTSIGSTLYFGGWGPPDGIGLWKYDSVSGETQPVNDVPTGSQDIDPTNLTNVNGTLFFSAFDSAHGRELWKSDGTAAGTVLVDDINPGTADSSPSDITSFNGKAYFFAQSGSSGAYQLWTSDGTAAGTHLLDTPSFTPTANTDPLQLLSLNGKLYFTADDGTHGVQVWESDGTTAGTVMLPATSAGGYTSPTNLGAVGNELLFTASDPAHGNELWKSDGTPAGTMLLKDIDPGDGSSYIAFLTNLGDKTMFTAYDGKHGLEPWITDGATAGTMLLKDLNATNVVAFPQSFIPYGDKLIFTSAEVITATPYREGFGFLGLWVTDGTDAGTVKLSSLAGVQPGSAQSPAWVDYNGAIYYAGAGGLWKTDGTAAGTSMVQAFTLPAGEAGKGSISSLAVWNNRLYFAGSDNMGEELWTSDGTAAGTHLVADISPPLHTGPQDFVPIGNELFFTADYGRLYRTDGTTAGTMQGGPSFVFPSSYYWNNVSATVNGISLFVASGNGTPSMQLYRTAGATNQYFRVLSSVNLSVLSGITLLNGAAYFLARDSSGSLALWKSDGTDSGTSIVAQVAPSSSGGSITGDLKDVNGILYFTDPAGALWRSDGTATGTVPALNTGGTGASPAYFILNNQAWSTAGSPVGFDNPPWSVALVDGQFFYTDRNQNFYAATPLPEAPPASPSALSAASAANGAIELQWSASSNQAAFVLNRSTDPSFGSVDLAVTIGDPQATTYVDHAAALGVRYYYRISSYDRAGSSGYSSPASAIAQAMVIGAALNFDSTTLPLTTGADGLLLFALQRRTDLPWYGIRQFQVTLDAAAVLLAADVNVIGANGANYGPVTLSASGNTYTLTLARPVTTADRLTLTIGNAAVAPYKREIDVLPGDVNDDGKVNFADFVAMSNHFGMKLSPIASFFGDFNGDGIVNFADFVILSNDFGKSLPAVQSPAIRQLAVFSATPIVAAPAAKRVRPFRVQPVIHGRVVGKSPKPGTA